MAPPRICIVRGVVFHVVSIVSVVFNGVLILKHRCNTLHTLFIHCCNTLHTLFRFNIFRIIPLILLLGNCILFPPVRTCSCDLWTLQLTICRSLKNLIIPVTYRRHGSILALDLLITIPIIITTSIIITISIEVITINKSKM